MKTSKGFVLLSFVVLGLFGACQQKEKKTEATDTYNKGELNIAADESFAPILDQELYVFKALNKAAKIHIIYGSENEVMRLYLNDSVRVAMTARSLNKQEMDLLTQKSLRPAINCFAYDGIAIIVNRSSADTLISVDEIKQMLNGKIKTDKNIVFDNANSSITRYLKELSANDQFKQKNIYALKSNVDVIKYVSENKEAFGFISYSWLLEPDKKYAGMVSNVKIVGVKDAANKRAPDTYFKSSQNTLAMQQYPLVRGLYILNSTGRTGLGTGFAAFMLSERGQRIVLRSGLLPDSIPTREIIISK